MATDEVHKRHREVAFVFRKKLERVKKNHCELNDLKDWQESFPPAKIRFGFRESSNKRQITVDHNVNERVEKTKEGRVTARQKLYAPPDRSWHNAVMCDVISVDKIKSFAENENESLEEVCELADEIPPRKDRHLKIKIQLKCTGKSKFLFYWKSRW